MTQARFTAIAAAFAAFAALAIAMPAVAQETTPAMVAAATKEGKVVWYASAACSASRRTRRPT